MRQIIVRCTCFPTGNRPNSLVNLHLQDDNMAFHDYSHDILQRARGKLHLTSQTRWCPAPLDWEIRNTGCLYAVICCIPIVYLGRFPFKTNVSPVDTWYTLDSGDGDFTYHAVLWCSVHSVILCISYHEIQLWLCRYLAEGWKTIFWSLPRIYIISDKVSEYRISCLTQFSRWSSLVIKCMNLSLITFLVKITTGRSADSAAKNV